MTAGDIADPVPGPSLDTRLLTTTVRRRVAGFVRHRLRRQRKLRRLGDVQPDQRTVQGELQTALAAVLRLETVALTVAGRTDSGVHATGQVAHVDVPAQTWAEAADSLLRRLAGVLPADVRVGAIHEVSAAFDARFAALWRRYEYRISDAASGADPLRRAFVLDHRRALDVQAMNQAAAKLVGLNDFVAFCKRRDEATTIRCGNTDLLPSSAKTWRSSSASRPTRSAIRWFVPWSVRSSPSAKDDGTRPGPQACLRRPNAPTTSWSLRPTASHSSKSPTRSADATSAARTEPDPRPTRRNAAPHWFRQSSLCGCVGSDLGPARGAC